MHAFKGICCLLFGTITWGLLWYPYRLLDFNGINGVYASLYSFIGALLLAVFLYRLKNTHSFLKKEFWIYAAIGGITNISYVLAVISGEVVRVMLLFFLSPIWTIPMSFFLLKEKIYNKNIIAALLAMLGAIIILWHENLFNEPLNLSDTFAIIAGIGFALTNVMARFYNFLSVQEKSYAIWLGVVVVSVITILLFQLHYVAAHTASNSLGLIAIIALTLLVTTLTVQYGLTLVKAVTASPIFLFEIIVAGVSAYFLANEMIGWKDLLGGIFIVLGIFISTRK